MLGHEPSLGYVGIWTKFPWKTSDKKGFNVYRPIQDTSEDESTDEEDQESEEED